MTYVDYKTDKDYKSSLEKVMTLLSNIQKVNSMAYHAGSKPMQSSRLLTVMRNIDLSGIESVIYSQILEGAYRSEIDGPLSTDLYIQEILRIHETYNSNENWNIFLKKEKEFLDTKKTELSNKRQDVKEKELKAIIDLTTNDKKISEMVSEALRLSGLTGTIFPEHSKSGQYSVELVTGYNFDVSTYPVFAANGQWRNEEVKVLVVDGVIETVSSIHGLLVEASKYSHPTLIVARGFGEEVIATIGASPKLNICPARVPFELESINIIADISIVSGGHVISTMKGDLLTSINFEELPVVDSVTCNSSHLNIVNKKTSNAVRIHLDTLSKRRETANVENMSEFITKRIRSLSSNTVYIRIGSKTPQQTNSELESIDYALRAARSALDKGVFQGFPVMSHISGNHHALSVYKNIGNIGCALMSID